MCLICKMGYYHPLHKMVLSEISWRIEDLQQMPVLSLCLMSVSEGYNLTRNSTIINIRTGLFGSPNMFIEVDPHTLQSKCSVNYH